MILSRLFPTTLLDFNRTFSNPLSEHDRANRMERYVLPTHQKYPPRNQITALNKNGNFAKPAEKVKTGFIKTWLLPWWYAVWATGEVWGCLSFYTNLFTHRWFQTMTFHNLHAGFGLEAMSLERSFTSNSPVLHKAATMAQLWVEAGGGRIVLCVMKNFGLQWQLTLHYLPLAVRGNIREGINKTLCALCKV